MNASQRVNLKYDSRLTGTPNTAVWSEQEMIVSCQMCIVLLTSPTLQMKQRTIINPKSKNQSISCLKICQINLRSNGHFPLFRDSMTPENFLSEMPSVNPFSLLTGHVHSHCSEWMGGSGAMPYLLRLVHLYSGQWEKAHVRSITENKRTTVNRIEWKMEANCLSTQCGFFAHLLRAGLVRRMVCVFQSSW